MDFFKSVSSAITTAVLPKKMPEDLKERYNTYINELNIFMNMTSTTMKLAIENGEISSKMIQQKYDTLGKRLAIDLRSKGFNDESSKIISISIDLRNKVSKLEQELMSPYNAQMNKEKINMYMGNLTRRATQQQLSRFPAPPSTLPVKTGGRRKTLRRKTRRTRKHGRRHTKA